MEHRSRRKTFQTGSKKSVPPKTLIQVLEEHNLLDDVNEPFILDKRMNFFHELQCL